MDDILAALDAALSNAGGLDDTIGRLYGRARSSDGATLDRLLVALDERIRAHDRGRVVDVAMLAGALVEAGADPSRFPPSVFDALVVDLGTIRHDDDELPAHYFFFEQAAVAALSRSPELRRTLPQKAQLQANVRRYRERYGFLGKMLRVLDDEPLVVIHVETERGFRFRMHGIADNFQLHHLLLDALAGEGPTKIRGVVPSTQAVRAGGAGVGTAEVIVASRWQLATFRGLQFGRAFVDMAHRESWIWNEGVPADIEGFDGSRVVLVGESTVERSWNAQRVFPGMAGRLDVDRALTPAETKALLVRMADHAARS